jgi:hypothetical protein
MNAIVNFLQPSRLSLHRLRLYPENATARRVIVGVAVVSVGLPIQRTLATPMRSVVPVVVGCVLLRAFDRQGHCRA